MYNGTISNNTGTDVLNNSTVYIEADSGNSTFNMYGGIIKDNKAAYGGVFIGKPAYPDFVSIAVMNMYDGTISGNTATGAGRRRCNGLWTGKIYYGRRHYRK